MASPIAAVGVRTMPGAPPDGLMAGRGQARGLCQTTARISTAFERDITAAKAPLLGGFSQASRLRISTRARRRGAEAYTPPTARPAHGSSLMESPRSTV